MKNVLTALARAGIFLVLLILVRFLFGGVFTISLRDLVMLAIFFVAMMIQLHFDRKKQIKNEKLDAEPRQDKSW